MRKDIAQGLGPLVKNLKLNKALVEYTDERIEWHKNQLVTSKNMEEVAGHQFAIKELMRFRTLGDEVSSILKKD